MDKRDKILNVISVICLIILAIGTIMDIVCVVSEWAWYRLGRGVGSVRCDCDDPDAPDFEPGF